MEKVTLSFTIDVSLAKYMVAFFSALTFNSGPVKFGNNLAHDDLPAALRYVSDQVYTYPDTDENLSWTRDERKWMERFVQR